MILGTLYTFTKAKGRLSIAQSASPVIVMEILDKILESYVSKGDETKDKVLGAAFIVVGLDGMTASLPVPSAPSVCPSLHKTQATDAPCWSCHESFC